MAMFDIETTFKPNDGFANSNDQMQITGIMATLYINRITNTIDNSSALFQ